MLGLAGIPLGLELRFLDPSPDAPAQAVGELVVGAYDDELALRRLADGADVVTYEFENVPAAVARASTASGALWVRWKYFISRSGSIRCPGA